MSLTVAAYLARRLHQLGVRHLFGVPGDFTLELLDAVAETGLLEWVGTANELDAGYAADGYARRRGLAAVVTTFGVGELSCLNAIAGSYAEQVPVIQVVGAPASGAAAAGALLHHTLADGDFGHFARVYREVTVAAEVLTAADPAAQIDRVLTAALRHQRPGYLSVPADLVSAPVDDAALERPLTPRAAVPPQVVAAFTVAAKQLLAAAAVSGTVSGTGAASDDGAPVVVVGHLVARCRLEEPLRRLLRAGRLRAVSLVSGKGTLSEQDPCFAGTYCGTLGDPGARAVVLRAPALIMVGAVMTDVVAGLFTHQDDPTRTVTLGLDQAVVGGVRFDLPLPVALAALTDVVAELSPGAAARPAGAPAPDAAAGPAGQDPLTQEELWARLQDWLPPGRTVLADIGTAFWGAVGLTFPADTVFVAQPVWSSIGYALPATLGCVLAEPDRRAVLLIGDGAASMTVQELGVLAARAPGTIVVLIDNAGYTIERALRSPSAAYHDVPGWDWCALARALSPDAEPLTVTARTGSELARALAAAEAQTRRLSVVRVVTPALATPPMLRSLAAAVGGLEGAPR